MREELERVEIAAFADLFRAAAGGEWQFDVLEIDGAVAGVTRAVPQLRLLNRVMGLTSTAPLNRIDAWYATCEYVVQARGLDEELESRGFTRGYAWMKFRRGVEPLGVPPTALRVERIGREHALDFGRVAALAYGVEALGGLAAAVVGRESWSCYLAFDADDAVGAGAAFFDGDAGWLGIAGTLPSARGRGAQNAILAARIAEAAERGCRVLAVETGERVADRPSNSYRNILRAGFEEAYLRPTWVAPMPR